MEIPETDVGKLFVLFKEHDRMMDDMLDMIGRTSDLIESSMKSNDRNMEFIKTQNEWIVLLIDEISSLKKRVEKLEQK